MRTSVAQHESPLYVMRALETLFGAWWSTSLQSHCLHETSDLNDRTWGFEPLLKACQLLRSLCTNFSFPNNFSHYMIAIFAQTSIWSKERIPPIQSANNRNLDHKQHHIFETGLEPWHNAAMDLGDMWWVRKACLMIQRKCMHDWVMFCVPEPSTFSPLWVVAAERSRPLTGALLDHSLGTCWYCATSFASMNEVRGFGYGVCSMSIVRLLYDLACVTYHGQLHGVSDLVWSRWELQRGFPVPPLLGHVNVHALCLLLSESSFV